MTSEVTIGSCRLVHGDCRDVLPALGRVDAVVTDPPYGIGEARDKKRNPGAASALPNTVHRQLYGVDDWDHETADDLVAQAINCATWSIVFGGNYYDLPPTSCWLIWDKINGQTDFADCEMAWTNLPKAVRLKKYLWTGALRAERNQGRVIRRVHPTQKPIEVMKWCIMHLPPPNDLILDPFMGSGTTGVACVKLGRRFIGIEREQKYFDVACHRIETAYAQPDLFVEQPKPVPPVQLMLLEPT